MTNSLPLLEQIEPLEFQLRQNKAASQRMEIIDQLLGYYVFTDIKRAERLLEELYDLLKNADLEPSQMDFQLRYHQYRALVANMRYDFERSVQYFNKAIQVAETTGTVFQQAEVLIDYAGTCMNNKENDYARQILEKAGLILKRFPHPSLQARLIARYGFLNLMLSDFSKAIEDLLEADKQLSSLKGPLSPKNMYFLGLIHSGLGTIYVHNDNYERSIQSYRKVVDMSESMNMRSRLSWNYLNLGNAYLAASDLENAEQFFLKAVQNPDDINPISHASAYANLGYCALQKENFKKALELLEKAEGLYQEFGNGELDNLGHIASWRAQSYDGMGQYKPAIEHFHMALNIAEELEDLKLASATSENIATFYANHQEWEDAYHFQALHSKYSDLYVRQVNDRRQMELEVKYDAEKKRQEAELLRLQATKLQLKALRAQMNPHFLYNALNSIQNYITSNKGNHAAKYLAKFAKLMRQSLEYSDLEFISLEKEIEFLQDYLYINEKLRFEDQLRYCIQVDEDIEEDILGVPTMIVQPYLENAIEHGLRTRNNGMIQLIFSMNDEKSILCIVEDNGIGRKKARDNQMQDAQYQNHKSRGTKITEDRLRILHNDDANKVFVRTIDMKDENGEPSGTRVEIKIPIVDIHMR